MDILVPEVTSVEWRWDLRFIGLAREIARWSKDPSTKVGSVIVRPDHTVASLGFNGFPKWVVDRQEELNDRDTRLLKVVHAELNAILHSREYLGGYTIYVTPFLPCSTCAGAIIQSGISRVVADVVPGEESEERNSRWRASFTATKEMFSDADVKLDIIDNYDWMLRVGYWS